MATRLLDCVDTNLVAHHVSKLGIGKFVVHQAHTNATVIDVGVVLRML